MGKTRRVKLKSGETCLVDSEDYDVVIQHNWFAKRSGRTCYARANITLPDGKMSSIYMHRLVLGLEYGDGIEVDHINHNGLDNRKSNLRTGTHKQNILNRGHTYGASKYKGVTLHNQYNKYVARITVNKKMHHIGLFDNEEDAARAYDRVAILEFGDYACTNFPREDYDVSDLVSLKQILQDRSTNKSSQYIGVTWSKYHKKWQSYMKINGKQITLGYFDSEVDAAKARDIAIKKHGLNVRFNFTR